MHKRQLVSQKHRNTKSIWCFGVMLYHRNTKTLINVWCSSVEHRNTDRCFGVPVLGSSVVKSNHWKVDCFTKHRNTKLMLCVLVLITKTPNRSLVFQCRGHQWCNQTIGRLIASPDSADMGRIWAVQLALQNVKFVSCCINCNWLFQFSSSANNLTLSPPPYSLQICPHCCRFLFRWFVRTTGQGVDLAGEEGRRSYGSCGLSILPVRLCRCRRRCCCRFDRRTNAGVCGDCCFIVGCGGELWLLEWWTERGFIMVMVSTISIVEKMRGSMGETAKNQRKKTND